MLNITTPADKIHKEGKLWWIASYPKSGNTWIRTFVDAYITGTVKLNDHFGRAVYGDLQAPWYQNVSPWPLKECSKYMIHQIRTAALYQALATCRGADLILKTHHANLHIDGIPTIPPVLTKGAVYLIRDPRDVVISWAHHTNQSVDEAIKSLNYEYNTLSNEETGLYQCLMSWSQHVKSWTEDNVGLRVVTVRYEDLLNYPLGYFSAVLKALGFSEVDSVKLRKTVEMVTFDKLRAIEDKEGYQEKMGGEKFFRVGKAGQWRDVLDDEQVYKIEEAHGEVMQKHGYNLISGVEP